MSPVHNGYFHCIDSIQKDKPYQIYPAILIISVCMMKAIILNIHTKMCITILVYLSEFRNEVLHCKLCIFLYNSFTYCMLHSEKILQENKMLTTFNLFNFPFGTILILFLLMLYTLCHIQNLTASITCCLTHM